MAFIFPTGFDPQPELQDGTIKLRPLLREDREALTLAASDPMIWEGHPAKDRYKSEIFAPYFDMLLASGSALIICDSEDHVIGCTVYYTDTNAPSRLSIGFTFLIRDHWGGETNRIIKGLTLDHIFRVASEAWFHIAPTNIRSQKATAKLGAVHLHDDDIDLGGGSQHWRCYCLTRENWRANNRDMMVA
jgi:RimJ/RimL family protein N-acetyltransferase